MKTLAIILCLICFAPTPNTSQKTSLRRILPPGVTIVYEPIILSSGMSLVGHPSGSTLILGNQANCSVIIVGDTRPDPVQLTENVYISSIKIVGNKLNQKYEGWNGPVENKESSIRNNGITIRYSKGVVIDNLDVSDCRSGGIVIERESESIIIINSASSENYFDGLAIYKSKFIYCNNVSLKNNIYAGFSSDLNFQKSVITNSTISDNGKEGIFMRFSRNVLFNNTSIFGNGGHSIFLAKSELSDSAAQNNIFLNCYFASNGLEIKENDEECSGNLLISPSYENKKFVSLK